MSIIVNDLLLCYVFVLKCYLCFQQTRKLTAFGGKHAHDATRRIMRRVIGHEANLLYNLTGAKGKLPFSELVQLNKVINSKYVDIENMAK